MTKEKFLKIIQKEKYFDQHKKILIALSGGQDSMTLFNWLHDLRDTLAVNLVVAHVNYGLREAAKTEEKKIRQEMAHLQIPLEVAYYQGQFTEADGRQMRYAFFKEVMKKYDCTALVTAHHRGDQVETLLMRLISGKRLRYLSGIKERQPFANGELIRPLLNFDKSELDAPEYFEDESNQSLNYFRNRVRQQYIPELTKENPQFIKGLTAISREIKQAFCVIDEQIEKLEIIQKRISLTQYHQQIPALKTFILQAYLERFPEIQLNREKFTELLTILERSQQYSSPLVKNYKFVKDADTFYIEEVPTKQENLEILYENPHDDTFFEVYLPASGCIEVRKRQPQDRILIHGRHKKLRKFFIENHISLEKRKGFLVLVDGEIYALANLVLSDLSKALKNGKMVRTIWVRPEK
jgi:tRNA(Ile)-lysidine synthase